MDDVLVDISVEGEHLVHLKYILIRLLDHDLVLTIDKCKFL